MYLYVYWYLDIEVDLDVDEDVCVHEYHVHSHPAVDGICLGEPQYSSYSPESICFRMAVCLYDVCHHDNETRLLRLPVQEFRKSPNSTWIAKPTGLGLGSPLSSLV